MKNEASGRVAPYLPFKRRKPEEELVIDAISDEAAEEIRGILKKHFPNRRRVTIRMEELSDKVFRVRNKGKSKIRPLQITDQRENVEALEAAIGTISDVLERDAETAKRVYLSLGHQRISSLKRYLDGQKKVRTWIEDFSGAVNFAAGRVPKTKPGNKKMFQYERWLFQELAATWHEETGESISVAAPSEDGNEAQRRWTKSTEIRRLFEIVLQEAGAHLSADQITKYLREARNENPYLRPPTGDDEASDQDYEGD